MLSFKSLLTAGLVLVSFKGLCQNYESEFQSRASQITNRLADTAAIKGLSGYFNQEWIGSGSTPDPEKHVWPVAIARLRKYGLEDTAANRLIDKYKNRNPFHFTYVGMARIMSQFASANQMANTKQQYLQQVWNRTDSYNCWTGEGTENHLNMNKTSGYLYAQHSLGNPQFPQASARMAEVKDWLRWFAKKLYAVGNSEWNSSTYQSYNVAGWLNLYDFALDAEVKAIARAVLDYYAFETAIHSSQGLTSGPESRGNTTAWGSGEDYLAWVWFGYQGRLLGPGFWPNKEYSQAMHAAASSYRPPIQAVKMARKEIALPVIFKNSKPDYNQNIGSYIKQIFYADQGYTLGSANIPHLGYAGGNSQYCNWKLVGRISPSASTQPQVVTGGSRFYNDKDGRGKTPFDQYVQHRNVLIQLHKIPANAQSLWQADSSLYDSPGSGWKSRWLSDFDQRFPNDNDRSNPVNYRRGSFARNISYLSYPTLKANGSGVQTLFRNNVFFIELDSCYLALRSLNLPQPSSPSNENTNRNFVADNAGIGNLCGLVLEVGSASKFVSFIAFQDSILQNTQLQTNLLAANKISYTDLSGNLLEAEFAEDGPAPKEPLYDWGFGPTTPQLFQTTPPYLQPSWTGGQGRGRIPLLKVNGEEVNYAAENWPVYYSSQYFLQNNILYMESDSANLSTYYEVDFSGTNPIFSSGIITKTANLLKTKSQPLEIFPNPATGETRIKAAGVRNGERVGIRVYTLNGARVLNLENQPYASAEGMKINISQFQKGIYSIELLSQKQSFSGKLIIQR